jgi:hypothetical protein
LLTDEGLEVIAETGKISRGGIQDYAEIRKIQRVRGELLNPTFKAKITFMADAVVFNMACVNMFPDNQYIVIYVDETNQRIIIEPCLSTERDSLKFATFKDKRNVPRRCTARLFCSMIYSMMGWNRTARYRIMAIHQPLGSKQVIVFNLDECLQVFTKMITSDDGKRKRSTILNMPEEWEGRYGHTQEELDAKNSLDTIKSLITVDNYTGERYANPIEAKLPTPEELIHSPYGGIRIKPKEADDNG